MKVGVWVVLAGGVLVVCLFPSPCGELDDESYGFDIQGTFSPKVSIKVSIPLRGVRR